MGGGAGGGFGAALRNFLSRSSIDKGTDISGFHDPKLVLCSKPKRFPKKMCFHFLLLSSSRPEFDAAQGEWDDVDDVPKTAAASASFSRYLLGVP
jgi:hypothetical protein